MWANGHGESVQIFEGGGFACAPEGPWLWFWSNAADTCPLPRQGRHVYRPAEHLNTLGLSPMGPYLQQVDPTPTSDLSPTCRGGVPYRFAVQCVHQAGDLKGACGVELTPRRQKAASKTQKLYTFGRSLQPHRPNLSLMRTMSTF